MDVDLAAYETMTTDELKNIACHLLGEKFSVQDEKKEYATGARETLKDIDARLEHIVTVLKTKESEELSGKATKVIRPPAKPKIPRSK